MEKRIELESRRKSPDKVLILNLDNCRSTSIEGLTSEFVNLRVLSLIGVGLTSLKGFPKLPSLTKLELSDNRIVGGLQVLTESENLEFLSLSNNKIKDLDAIEPLKDLKFLKNLELGHNDVNQIDEYRTKIFDLLPGLTYLDGCDRNGKEPEESEQDDSEDGETMVDGTNGKESGTKGDSAPGAENEDGIDEELADEEEEDDEADVETESDSNDESIPTVGLKDIYREDLDKESDDGDYDDEEESESDSDEDLDDSHDVSAVSGASEPGSQEDLEDTHGRGKKREREDDSPSASGDGKDDDIEDGPSRGKKLHFDEDEDDSG